VSVAAVVPAAGRGERLGPGGPKALRLLGGVPLLVHAVRALAEARLVDVVVVAAPPDQVAQVRGILDAHHVPAEVSVVAGGETRQASVRLALEAVSADVVLVHDAARPLAPADLVDDVARCVLDGAEAVVPVLAIADTVKEVDTGGQVVRTVDRDTLRLVQTPQGFRRSSLLAAHEYAERVGGTATDDAGLVERAGGQVVVVPGSPEAFKVTRPMDLVVAEALLARRRAGRAI
jgi:2-C-methyl-D-erythritol 4-phosphate cytidylyltransferase